MKDAKLINAKGNKLWTQLHEFQLINAIQDLISKAEEEVKSGMIPIINFNIGEQKGLYYLLLYVYLFFYH